MNDLTGWVGIGAGLCTGVSQVPQLYKIIQTKKAENISYGMLAILITGLAGWVWYGMRKNDLPIVFTNAFAVLINLLTIVFSVKYKNKNEIDEFPCVYLLICRTCTSYTLNVKKQSTVFRNFQMPPDFRLFNTQELQVSYLTFFKGD